MPRVRALKINSVDSAHGHAFIGSGECQYDDAGNLTGYYEDCLTCGAHYILVPMGPGHVAYRTASGDAPMQCSRDTAMAHGYPAERYCHCHEHQLPADRSEHTCEHVTHDCNCLLCGS